MEAIVAVFSDWGIGSEGTQQIVLKADRKHFREVTGGDAVLVGRRTLGDFPGGRPLPGRHNIVLTRQRIEIPGAEVVHSEQEAAEAAARHPRCLVIGGASVYRQMMPWIDRVHVTKIARAPVSDSFFPDLDADPDWTCEESGPWLEENGVSYCFCTYRRLSGPGNPAPADGTGEPG
ncbi:MAG: dihydrofolate reductase [Oscillospiraceae bacterium]|nr:dihydrofolate reductase [Oscillospiraceae bacterium]